MQIYALTHCKNMLDDGLTRLPVAMVEGTVIGQIRLLVRAPEVASRLLQVLRADGVTANEKDIIASLDWFDALWGRLFPAEQARIVLLLVERVAVGPEGITLDLHKNVLRTFVADIDAVPVKGVAA